MRKVSKAAVDAFRRAVRARLEYWDATEEVEREMGADSDMTELIDSFAVSVDFPADALDLPSEEVTAALLDHFKTEDGPDAPTN